MRQGILIDQGPGLGSVRALGHGLRANVRVGMLSVLLHYPHADLNVWFVLGHMSTLCVCPSIIVCSIFGYVHMSAPTSKSSISYFSRFLLRGPPIIRVVFTKPWFTGHSRDRYDPPAGLRCGT